MERDLVSALYGELSDAERRQLDRRVADDDASRERLEQWQQLHGALRQLASDTDDPPPRLRNSLMTEAALELRIRDTEGLDDAILEADGTRRVVKPQSGSDESRPRLTPGNWATLAAAAMVLLAVTLAIAFDPMGVRRAGDSRGVETTGGQATQSIKTGTPEHPENEDRPDNGTRDNDRQREAIREIETSVEIISLDHFRGKSGIEYDGVLAAAWDTVTRDNPHADDVRNALNLAWSVYNAPDASDEERGNALMFVADNGVRLEDPDAASTVAVRAEQLLADSFRELWLQRKKQQAEAAGEMNKRDTPDDQNNSPPPGMEQQRQNGPFDLPPPDQRDEQKRDNEDGQRLDPGNGGGDDGN